MTGKEALKRLGATKLNELTKLDALAREIDAQSRAPLDALAGHWAGKPGAERDKAAIVLGSLDELSIRAWLAVLGGVATAQRLEGASQVADAYVALQERFTKVLVPMLDDKTKLPQPKAAGPVDERRPSTRVCDEAYLLLRHLLKIDDRQVVRLECEHWFLRLTDPQRDEEIKLYKDKRAWSTLAELSGERRAG